MREVGRGAYLGADIYHHSIDFGDAVDLEDTYSCLEQAFLEYFLTTRAVTCV